MRELFGGHSRYAIEGFAEQLQTLSESHSVQVKTYFLSSHHLVFHLLSVILCLN